MTDNILETPDAYDELVTKCIEMYKKLLNNGMALDACKIQGKMRAIILKDERYITETRAIKAQQYLNEINQINDIYKAATKMGGAYSEYDGDDGRDGGMSDKQVLNAQKEALNMQIKAADMRRNLLSLTAESSDDNEDSAVNFYFTALSREEMIKIKQVEINEGSTDESAAMKELKKQSEDDIATKTLKRKEQAKKMHGKSEEDEEVSDPDAPVVFRD